MGFLMKSLQDPNFFGRLDFKPNKLFLFLFWEKKFEQAMLAAHAC